jgi:hypothetical protein
MDYHRASGQLEGCNLPVEKAESRRTALISRKRLGAVVVLVLGGQKSTGVDLDHWSSPTIVTGSAICQQYASACQIIDEYDIECNLTLTGGVRFSS